MNNKKEKTYVAEVQVTWTQVASATSKKSALKSVKDTFIEEFGFEPTDDEIKLLEEK